MNFLKGFFHDGEGSPSMMRLMLFIAFVIILGILVWKNLHTTAFVDMPTNARDVLFGVLFGKFSQTAIEKSGSIIDGIKSAFKGDHDDKIS